MKRKPSDERGVVPFKILDVLKSFFTPPPTCAVVITTFNVSQAGKIYRGRFYINPIPGVRLSHGAVHTSVWRGDYEERKIGFGAIHSLIMRGEVPRDIKVGNHLFLAMKGRVLLKQMKFYLLWNNRGKDESY